MLHKCYITIVVSSCNLQTAQKLLITICLYLKIFIPFFNAIVQLYAANFHNDSYFVASDFFRTFPLIHNKLRHLFQCCGTKMFRGSFCHQQMAIDLNSLAIIRCYDQVRVLIIVSGAKFNLHEEKSETTIFSVLLCSCCIKCR